MTVEWRITCGICIYPLKVVSLYMANQNPFPQDSRQYGLTSPDQIGSTLRITALPTYLIALTAILLVGAFFVWGFLGTVSDKVYYPFIFSLSDSFCRSFSPYLALSLPFCS